MAKERILIVEDEKIIALDLLRRLERFGYVVVGLASDGTEALELIKAHKPDLVLMDIMLSGDVDGIEAALKIKAYSGTPLIFLTAYADEQTLERAKEADPVGYILKPFKERELYTTIDIALYKISVDKRLKQQEQLFSAILHSIGDAIISTDVKMMINFMNPQAELISGCTEDDAKGKSIGQVINLTDSITRKNIIDLCNDLKDSQPFRIKEAVIKSIDGKTRLIQGSLMHIHEENNQTEGYLIVLNDITEIKKMSATIDYQASHDILTGLSNREEFAYKLNELVKQLSWQEEEHALVVIDIDRFKVVNDTAGTIAGDELLRTISKILGMLTQKNDICARIGADEFSILLMNCTPVNAEIVCKRLQDAINSTKFIWNGITYPITLSIGIVPLNKESSNIQRILASADDACFLSKEEGGNRINLFHSGEIKYKQRRGEMEWIGKINRAIEKDQFILYYQPIEPVDSTAHLGKKLEILLRLVSENGTIISPSAFMPAAERYNLMGDLDRWVIKNTFKAFKLLRDKKDTLALREFSINLSGSSILDDTIESFIINELEQTGVEAKCFCFEITETSAIQNLSYAQRFIKRMKDVGFAFSLDDFGSGFSSFSYLKNLSVDYLKLDGSFVQNIDENIINRTMVESINSLGHVMGLKTIAEFVKSKSILETIQTLKVDYAQGYYISEPVPLL